MSHKESSIAGGGKRVVQRGNDPFMGEYVRQTDYDRNGREVSRVKTDSNGDQWREDSSGSHRIGNDGRNK